MEKGKREDGVVKDQDGNKKLKVLPTVIHFTRIRNGRLWRENCVKWIDTGKLLLYKIIFIVKTYSQNI